MVVIQINIRGGSDSNNLQLNSTQDSVICEYGYQNLALDICTYLNSHPEIYIWIQTWLLNKSTTLEIIDMLMYII